MNRFRRRGLGLILLAVLARPASADVVTDWNKKPACFLVARCSPPQPERPPAMTHPAMVDAANSGELMGYRGDRLKGSISCIHPGIIDDLIVRVDEAANYTGVLRIYIQQGYCIEADIPTILVRPMADHTFRTWDGHEAEIWETVLTFDHGDGTSETLNAYSIVFPREMKQTYGL